MRPVDIAVVPLNAKWTVLQFRPSDQTRKQVWNKSIGYYGYHTLWHYKSLHFAHAVFWLILRIKHDCFCKQYQTFNIIKEEKCSLWVWNSFINIIYINFRFKGERNSRLCLMEFDVRNYVTPLINALYFGLYLQDNRIKWILTLPSLVLTRLSVVT